MVEDYQTIESAIVDYCWVVPVKIRNISKVVLQYPPASPIFFPLVLLNPGT